MNNSYSITTPAYNELDNLKKLSSDVSNQTVKPDLWLIVDDGSDDGTVDFLDNLSQKYSWVKWIDSGIEGQGHFNRVWKVIRKGINFLLKKKTDYIGILAADTRISEKYYETIVHEMESDEKLGVCAGLHYENGKPTKKEYPREAGILYRRQCLLETGYQGHVPTIIKARNRGWKDKTIEKAKIIHKRPSDKNKNLFEKGHHVYWIGNNLISTFLTSIYFMIFRSPFAGISYLYGFLDSMIKGKGKIEDKEIREYYKKSPFRLVKRIAKSN